jgi:TRAP-type C4-dicarboxylate transport system permease small subunit
MQKEVVAKIADLVTTAFGLVAALAWNTAIQSWFDSQEALKAGGPWVYAVLVTIIAVVATVWIGRIAGRLGHE